jgi:hypothetical protein
MLRSAASRFEGDHHLLATYAHRHISNATGTCNEVVYNCRRSGMLSEGPQLAQMEADADLSILATDDKLIRSKCGVGSH